MKRYFIFLSIIMLSVLLIGCDILGDRTNSNSLGNFSSPVYEDIEMTPRNITQTSEKTSVAVSKNVSPAVVGITSDNGYSYSVGSGVAVAKGGYVLTNYHVITNKDSITLYLADGKEARASYVWGDYGLDMAIVKSEVDLPYLNIASSDSPSIGEDVLAIGTPLQLQFKHSVTKGIVSALNRTVQVGDDSASSLQSLIQHDASINPGNSGGPLVNYKSEVVGINTLKIESAEGMGFAIPAITIDNVLSSVLDEGTYESAYLGVFGYDSAIPYHYKKSASKTGMYLIDVQKESPAQLAGLKSGDIILAINDTPINTALDFKREFFAYKKGDTVTIKYMQDGHIKTVEVTLQKRPEIKKL